MRPLLLLSVAALSLSACTAQSPSSAGMTPPPEDTQAMAEYDD